MCDIDPPIRPAPWWLLVLALASAALLTVIGNQWYGPSGIWKPVDQATQGLVNQTLLFSLVYFLVLVCGVLFGLGRQRPAGLGLTWPKLPAGALYTLVLWACLQGMLAGWYQAFQSLAIASDWTGDGAFRTIGRLLGQLFGNALCEEIVFRGFLLMQFVALLHVRLPSQPKLALITAFVLVTAVFAALHLPFQLSRHSYSNPLAIARDQAEVFIIGAIFGWIYWRTRNLFFTVGVHALANAPTTVWAWHDLGPVQRADIVVYPLALVIASLWQYLPGTGRRTRQNCTDLAAHQSPN